MNQQDLRVYMEKFFQGCIDISIKKNQDYAKDSDPFLNFRAAESVGATPEGGILIRMSDKLVRASNVIKKGRAAVSNETLEDTLKDLANYSAILSALLHEKEGKV